jgi:L-aminopeptidase/D-esterase-like protein
VLSDVAGIRVGHWSDPVARTGCTVVLLPPDTVASGEVRGGAPASRELALLAPERLVDHVDAVVLTGGSAFGLASADGVMAWCEEQGRGFPTPAGPVPIVPTLGLYDLAVGDATVRPGPAEGRAAAEAADAAVSADHADHADHEVGPVGAGTGCTTEAWRGPDAVVAGGLGAASRRHGEVVVAALVAVNAAGGVDPDGSASSAPLPDRSRVGPFALANTTIGVIATNARLDPTGCLLTAQSGHDGLARSLFPVHTRVDGDALVAVATGELDADVDLVRVLATQAVEAAVRSVAAPEAWPQGEA